MNPNLEQRLQAWVDGQLDPEAAREVEAWMAQDPQARALGENLRALSTHLRAHEPTRVCPETPDFYWAGIRRGIEAEENRRESRGRANRPLSGVRGWLAWLVPAGAALAALLVVMRPAAPEPHAGSQASSVSSARGTVAPMVGHEIVEPEAEGLETVTFYSAQESMTVVWLARADVL